jgi:hypothetical protein
MKNHETDTQTLVKALRILANNITSDDGVANAVISEGADRIEKLLELVDGVYDIVDVYNTYKEKEEFVAFWEWKQNWLKTARQYGAGPDI